MGVTGGSSLVFGQANNQVEPGTAGSLVGSQAGRIEYLKVITEKSQEQLKE